MLYEEKQVITGSREDLEETLKWFAYTNELAKGGDPSIARKYSDLTLKRDDLEIKELEGGLPRVVTSTSRRRRPSPIARGSRNSRVRARVRSSTRRASAWSATPPTCSSVSSW